MLFRKEDFEKAVTALKFIVSECEWAIKDFEANPTETVTSPITLAEVRELKVTCSVLTSVIEDFKYNEGEVLKKHDEKILIAALEKATAVLH